MVKKCKGKTIVRAGSDGKESCSGELIPSPQHKAKEKGQPVIDNATCQALDIAVNGNDLMTVIFTISQLHGKKLTGNISKELRERVYNYLRGRLREMVQEDEKVCSTKSLAFYSLVGAICKIGLHDRLISEEKMFYAASRIPESWYMPMPIRKE
jgi:hypothetical protein